jgi:hypothetical protein
VTTPPVLGVPPVTAPSEPGEPPLREPPVLDEPPVVDEPPVLDEPPVVDEPPVLDEPPVVDVPPVDEPPVLDVPPLPELPPLLEHATIIKARHKGNSGSAVQRAARAKHRLLFIMRSFGQGVERGPFNDRRIGGSGSSLAFPFRQIESETGRLARKTHQPR